MATIKINTRDVDSDLIRSLPDQVAPQHTFITYTNDNGIEQVLRGGQVADANGKNNNLNIGNVKDGDLLTVLDIYQEGSIDWKTDAQTIHSTTIASGSDSAISQIWESMIEKAQEINNQGYDYELLTQNCNTTTKTLIEAGQLKYDQLQLDAETNQYSLGINHWSGFELPSGNDNNTFWTPGTEQDFNHSLFDKLDDIITNNQGDFAKMLEYVNLNPNNETEIGNVDDFRSLLKTNLEQELGQSLENGAFKDIISRNNQYSDISNEIDIVKQLSNRLTGNQGLYNLNISGNLHNINYQIQPGDTLSSISLKSGVSIDKLLDLNPQITNPDEIFSGDNLVLREGRDSVNVSVNGDSYGVFKGDGTGMIAESSSVKKDFDYLDEEGNVIDESDAVIKIEDTDEEGNSRVTHTAIRQGTQVELSEGGFTPLSSLIAMGKSAARFTQEFVDGYINTLKDTFTSQQGIAGLISDVATGIQRGDEPEQIARFIATKAAIKQLLSQGSDAIKQQIQKALVNNADKAVIESGNLLDLSPEGVESLQGLDTVTSHPAFQFGYATAITYVTTLLLSYDEGWDSQEYMQAAVQATAQVGAQFAVTNYFGSGAGAAGVGAAVAYVISATINDLFADDSMDSHQWQSTLVSASAIGAAAWIGALAFGPVGAVLAGVIITQLMGGKEFEEGEYPDPYSFLKIEAKDDGSGNIIYGIEKDGVIAFAREYYHDDIYGTNGNDILVGKSGTNTLVGRAGDDLLEGRGDQDKIYGGEGNDIIEGGNGDDFLFGEDGQDQIHGGGGNDVIIAGNGDDIVYGGIGDDQIEGNEGNDIIYGEAGADTIIAGKGNDIIESGAGNDIILGEDGADQIAGGDGNDTIEGGDGIDIILGEDGNDNIKGGLGDDEIYGGDGNDIINGESGSDLLFAGNGDDLILAGVGNDIAYGGEGDDSIHGEIGDDYVIGGLGNDVISGFIGDDVLFAGKGNDEIAGGDGLDTFIFRKGDGADIITDSAGINDVIKFTDLAANQLIISKDSQNSNNLLLQVTDNNDNPTSDQIIINNQLATENPVIETLEFINGQKIDLTKLTFDENSQAIYQLENYQNIDTNIQAQLAIEYAENFDIEQNTTDLNIQINANSSWYNDNYHSQSDQEINNEHYNEVQWRSYKKARSAFGGHYTVWYKYFEKNLQGTNGNDRIVGNWWNENLYGEGGDDQLYGNKGNDVIYGQDGNDYINGGADNDAIYGGNGFDKLEGGTGNDIIYGGNQNDTIFGQWGDDAIYGNNHDDFINGGKGDDIISGDIDPATLTELKQELENLKSIPSYILNSSKLARLFAAFNIEVPSSQKIEALEGLITNLEAGNDIILAGDGDDTVTGDQGNDLIIGNNGHDKLSGNDGNDTIHGRSGNDVIEAGAGDDYVSGGQGDDIIAGGAGNDIIYGDSGFDKIEGGAGSDNIYGGSDTDIINGGAGDDFINGGSGTNIIEGNEGNDRIFGGEDSDQIAGGAGDDIIFGKGAGDVIFGNEGDDILSGGAGNDIITDGTGNDTLRGDTGNDIFIITTKDAANNIDNIEDFNKDEDRIIIKIDYQNPITFAQLQSKMTQNGNNIIINLDNNQQIIVKNTQIADLTQDNLAIGLAGGQNDDILFGTDSDNVLFGEAGDDKIYGGAGNDEIWGGKGGDMLYGEDGDDILRYEADGTFLSDINASLVGYTANSVYGHHAWQGHHFYLPTNDQRDYYQQFDVAFKHDDAVASSHRAIATWTTKHKRGSFGGHYLRYHAKVNYNNKYAVKHYFTKNFYDNQQVNINGYNRSFDSFDGGNDSDILLLTDGNDLLALDDATSQNSNPGQARVQNIETIYAGAGDDIINFTSPNYNHGDVLVYGAQGDDHIWSSIGDDRVFGGAGNDEIYTANGNDIISGGNGDDVIIAGKGNDAIEGGAGNDVIKGGDGDDLIEGGKGADNLDGGAGNDTISYANSLAAVNVNIANNQASGGDASGDIITNFENITGSNFNDVITGNSGNNILQGKAGDDIIYGGGGIDTYIYNLGDGHDIIDDHLGATNQQGTLSLSPEISKSELQFSKNWNDLTISFKNNSNDSVTIKNQLQDPIEIIDSNSHIIRKDSKIANITFANGQQAINLAHESLIFKEDSTITIDLTQHEKERILANNLNLIAAFGQASYNQDTGLISYIPNANFNGIDEFSYQIKDEQGQILRSKSFNLFIEAVNDNPEGQIADQETMVDQEFSINLNDFISDPENDNLTYSAKLKNQQELPYWLNLDQKTGILTGIFGRDGTIDIEITAQDGNGGIFNTEFAIKANYDLSQRAVDIPEVAIVNGGDDNDIIIAQEDSQDLIAAKAGDDIIYFTADDIWQDSSYETFHAWNVYSGDKIAIAGLMQSFDSFDGGIGNDELILSDANDVLFLDDPVTSSLSNSARISGIEIINGGLGDDIIDLTSLKFEYGDVTINGGAGDDILWSNSGNDILNGGAGNDNLQAGTGDDILNGDQGDDILKGYDGNETLTGGAGADTLTGGLGFDSFNFTSLNDSTISKSDLIIDFTKGQDSINFSNLGFTAIQAGEGQNTILGYSYDQETDLTTIADINSDFAINLSGKIELANDDFNFIS